MKPKFSQKWTYHAYGHVIYCWKGSLKLISVVETFVGIIEADLGMIRMKFCLIIQSKFGLEGNYAEQSHVINEVLWATEYKFSCKKPVCYGRPS